MCLTCTYRVAYAYDATSGRSHVSDTCIYRVAYAYDATSGRPHVSDMDIFPQFRL